jgi:hypothetical protein
MIMSSQEAAAAANVLRSQEAEAAATNLLQGPTAVVFTK